MFRVMHTTYWHKPDFSVVMCLSRRFFSIPPAQTMLHIYIREAIIICLIQHFEADFPKKVSLKILNSGIIICLIQHFEADFPKKVSLKILNSEIILNTFTHEFMIPFLCSWVHQTFLQSQGASLPVAYGMSLEVWSWMRTIAPPPDIWWYPQKLVENEVPGANNLKCKSRCWKISNTSCLPKKA